MIKYICYDIWTTWLIVYGPMGAGTNNLRSSSINKQQNIEQIQLTTHQTMC